MGMRRDPDLDFLLTMALDIHDNDLLCPCGCGFYSVDVHDPDSEDWFAVDDSTICAARAARESWDKEDGKDAEPGTLLAIVDERVGEARKRKLPPDRYTRPANTAALQDDALG